MTPRQFAIAAHGDQKYGEFPYVMHLDEVADVLREFGQDGSTFKTSAAYLHDVLEDTSVTREELAAEFDETISDLVWSVTGVGLNRKARNTSAYYKIRCGCSFSEILKLADRVANVRASIRTSDRRLEMYRKEHPEFRGAIMLSPFAKPMWDELDRLLGFSQTSEGKS